MVCLVKKMDFLLESLRPWNSGILRRQDSETNFGLPIERGESVASVCAGSGVHPNGLLIDQPFCVQRMPSLGQIIRFPSNECIRRFSSIDMAGLPPAADALLGFSELDLSRKCSAPRVDDGDSRGSGDTYPGEDEITTADIQRPRRRTRCDPSAEADGFFENMDATRPWEAESTDSLNTVPEGFSLPNGDFSLTLGDLRVIARYHVQKIANAVGIKLAAGMTNSDLVELAHRLGMYPLVYRIHLEATRKIALPELHKMYLDYKRESKLRAKRCKANRDMSRASQVRITQEGKITIDYFEGISLRLGRERDTVFRPFLHRVFREHKSTIREKLAAAGLNHNEMRKWRDTQLCTAIWVADEFVNGIWQTAVDVHFSKSKDL